MSSSLINDRFRDDALMMRDMLRARVYAAKEYICHKLGFNGWSRDLHDEAEIYAFLLPPEIYENEVLVEAYKKFISDVFYAHFLTVIEVSVMRNTSQEAIREAMGEEKYDPERYCVDWCGSRCRDVELGPHIYFHIGFDGWVSNRVMTDPAPSDELRGICWQVLTEERDRSDMKQWAELSAERGV